MDDIRDYIFKKIIDQKFSATVVAESAGVLSGVNFAKKKAQEIGINFEFLKEEGSDFASGEILLRLTGTPKQIALAEETIIGSLAKYSGIASSARKAVNAAGSAFRIVAGSWKKMPPEVKSGIRQAVVSGGASFRISKTPMIYLDKNYIRMFGSIAQTLDTVKDSGLTKVVQIKGIDSKVEKEALEAITHGCDILMIDTGRPVDIETCSKAATKAGLRGNIEIAFAGGVKINNIKDFIGMDVDVLCIGKDIVDAPLVDMKMDVVLAKQKEGGD